VASAAPAAASGPPPSAGQGPAVGGGGGSIVTTSALSAATSRASSPLSRTQGALGLSMPSLPPPPLGLSSLVQGALSKYASATPLAVDGKASAAVQCGAYQPDPVDSVDIMVSKLLQGMDHEALSRLMVRRLTVGKYEIDGRQVSIYWAPPSGEGSAAADELLVREDEVGGEEGSPEVSLPAYLLQAANVAAALRGRVPGASAVTRIPQEKRLTFSTPGSDALESLDVLQRCASMRKACEEAALRERAAEAYENGMQYVPLPTQPTEPDLIKAGADPHPSRSEGARQAPVRKAVSCGS